jgi:peptide/nickel transport system permease protein
MGTRASRPRSLGPTWWCAWWTRGKRTLGFAPRCPNDAAMSAAPFVLRRCLRLAAIVWAVVTLVFVLVRVVGGDPVDLLLGDQATPEDRAHMRQAWGLDRSLPEQYARFVGQIVDGTLGRSFRYDTQVSALLAQALASTFVLAALSMGVALSIAVVLGVSAAARQSAGGARSSEWITAGALVASAIPSLWLGPMLIWLFCVHLRWLPFPGDDAVGLQGIVLPVATLGLALAALLVRHMRSSMLGTLAQPFVIAARARGLSRPAVLRHALRNAWIPVLTVAASQFGSVLSGAVIVEKLFERRGLGSLFLEAFFARDLPVIQGCVLTASALYVLVQTGVDILYGLLDPRIRMGASHG